VTGCINESEKCGDPVPGLERIACKLGNIAPEFGGPWEIVVVRGGKCGLILGKCPP
jgi:hypothetical protein